MTNVSLPDKDYVLAKCEDAELGYSIDGYYVYERTDAHNMSDFWPTEKQAWAAAREFVDEYL